MNGIPESRHPAACSPRELWLERRVIELEQELKHRSYEQPLPQFSAYADADEIVIHRDPGFQLMIAGSMNSSDQHLHVRTTLWTDHRKNLRYDYFVSQGLLNSLNPASKAQLMVEHHQEMIYGVGREMWGQ
jgi:hypothetical protein